MRTGAQSLGWYVLRAKNPVSLIKFYRDVLGLGELRGREAPPETASAMLWAGGTTVFKPNRGGQGEYYNTVEECPFIPVFRSKDISATQRRLEVSNILAIEAEGQEDTHYYRDPLGYIFGLESVQSEPIDRLDPNTGKSLRVPDSSKSLAPDILDLGRLEYRVSNPDQVTQFYSQAMRFEVSDGLNMGDGCDLRILPGASRQTHLVQDREQATMVPVFRIYGYNSFIESVSSAGAQTLQEVELTGGKLWYGWDLEGHLFGFQERKAPDPDPLKWTTRLPEDILARRLWDSAL